VTELVHATGTDVLDAEAIRVSETAWEPLRLLDYNEWAHAGETLQRVHRASAFWVGDWLAYGSLHYPEVWEQAVDLTGLEYKTLQVIMDVAEKMPPSRRIEGLSWSHHRAVAYLDDTDTQDRLLGEAQTDGLTVAKLRARVQGRPDPEPASLTDGVAWKSTVTFLHAGMNADDAKERAQALAGLMARRGAQIAHTETEALEA